MLRSGAFRAAARIAALFVLTWTATDLSNPEVCALDQEGLQAPGDRTSEHPAGTDDDVHFDDCFCCSHCVEPTFVFHVNRASGDAGCLAPRRVRAPQTAHPRLYRPPQLPS